MPFSKKFRKIMGFPQEGDNVNQFTVESLSVEHVHIKRSKPRRYEYPVKMVVQGKGSKEDAKAAFGQLLCQENVRTTSGYGNPYSCCIGEMKVSKTGREEYSISAKGRCVRVSDEAHRKYVEAKLKELEETALRVYEAMFQNESSVEINGLVYRFSETPASKVRFAKIDGYTFIEQNPKKDSRWGRMAQEGHSIMWICKGPAYLYRVMDGQLLRLRRKKGAKSR